MENDPLKQLTDFFKSEGYVGKEAVEEAKAELERRHQRQLDLNQSAASAGLPAALVQTAATGSTFQPVFFPPPPPAPEVFIYMSEVLRDVNGSLTVLSPHHGFRKFVQAKARELGITGSIQRYHHSDVRIQFEGTIPQVKLFTTFLSLCRQQGMIGMFDGYKQSSYALRLFDDFLIDKDFSRTSTNGGKVIKGRYSDGDEYDKVSEYSADSPMVLGYQIGDHL